MLVYAKFLVAIVAAALIALQVALADGGVSTSEWVTILLAAIGAVGVYAVPNRPSE